MDTLRLDNMDSLRLTDEEIRQIILVSQRFLINESTHPDDLRAVLVERLQVSQPALAAKIGRMNQGQMTNLCQTMLVR